MARFRESTYEEESDNAIDISPLIDCVFILLIFFIVTARFVEEPGIEVQRPVAASAQSLAKTCILIAVTENGEVVYGGREIGVNGVAPLVERMLKKDNVPVIVQADATAKSGTYLKVVKEAELAGALVYNATDAPG